MREDDEAYFESIETRLEDAIALANEAKSRGEDPRPEIEIPVAKDMADRVENILGIDGVADRVRELEGEMSREEAALELVGDFVEGTVGDYDTKAGKVEGAVRTAVALLTEGVVAAPIEGIDRVEVNENDDGTEYISVYYAGPIRSAGGTAQALSVLVADYARALLGIEEYEPRTEEIKRYAEEVALYDQETGLQYSPKDEETEYIARHTPICLDGEATGQEEVSGYRDLERVDTNSPRGGMCLVLAEGIALKAPKIQRYTRNLEAVDWPWLQDLIDGTITGDTAEADDEEVDQADEPDESRGESAGPPRVDESWKYLRDLIAGRPVFGHPSTEGGFRLRYGRARNHGFATAGVHPATMHLVDDFLATGTQIKTERPGKAAGVVPVDSIEGPTVKLANGDVRRVDDPGEALEVRNGVEKILDLGEYLVNYGEFVENNHPLAPASYTVEWWVQDLAAAGADVQALRDSPYVDLSDPDPTQALNWATDHDAPLHPAYTYLWHDLDVDRFVALAEAVADGRIEDGTLHVDRTEHVRETLEVLLVEHHQTETALLIEEWVPLARTLGVSEDLDREWAREDLSAEARDWDDAMKAANEVAPFELRERAPTRIGNRMGRPEKSESRDLSPAVHTLFPIADAGGDQRDVGKAATHAEEMNDRPGRVEVSLGVRECEDCGEHTYRARCPDCGGRTQPHYECDECGIEVDPDESGRVECPRCEREVDNVEPQVVDLNAEYHDALTTVGERENAFDVLKGVKGLTSAEKVPEPIEKGVLRAKHGVTAFKDGTVRYDMTDLPVTAVRPAELDVTVEQFRELGYEEDVHGEPLEHDDQLVELRVQDVVLSDGAAEHMLKTADFVDELLDDYYDLAPFYDVDDRDDLVGELVFGMAPHTSAAVVGRVVGFTSAAVGYAHPYFHASKRRNCFVPETNVWFRDETGRWRHEPIEAVVERRLDDPWTDDLGTLVEDLEDPIHVPSLEADGSPSLEPVSAVSKHVATDHLIRIETRSGRSLTVTPDHSMRTWDDGVCELEAHRIEEGDVIPTPKSVDLPGEVPEYDLLEEFLESDAVPDEDLVIRGLGAARLERIFDDATAGPGSVQSVATKLDVSASTVSDWIERDRVPASVLVRLLGVEDALDRVPASVTLGIRGGVDSIERSFSIDAGVATALGHYTASGFATRSEESGERTTIVLSDDAARRPLASALRQSLGVEEIEESGGTIEVSNRLVAALFTAVLELGSEAEQKRIPDALLAAPDAVLRAYLAAYFGGAGSVAPEGPAVRATTVSDELKSDLVAALKRFGVVATISAGPRRRDSGAVSGLRRDGDERTPSSSAWVVDVDSTNAARFAETIGFDRDHVTETLEEVLESTSHGSRRKFADGGAIWLDEVVSVEVVESDVEHTYSLTVENTHTLLANDLFVGQCDGDEDCVMLLMDGLLNFSKSYLPDKRGGRMDAPLVMTSRIDPTEIDDEAHNIDVVDRYPREFYEATREMADPGDVEIPIAGDSLGTEGEYSGFRFTHDTSNIALGPDLSAYKTLGSMMEKMDAQLELARKLRAVDETDVAERVIEYHFLPDLIGNLRAFSRQETRCLSCGEKYRRVPLSGVCRECGGDVTLTVHEGSVTKYLDTALEVADEYGAREYTKQRLQILERSIESIFENDKNKPTSLGDFM
ncbi:MAG: DNA polymerase II large subunit [Halanaeroarchaeum sp.]